LSGVIAKNSGDGSWCQSPRGNGRDLIAYSPRDLRKPLRPPQENWFDPARQALKLSKLQMSRNLEILTQQS